ncbi:MAG: hypothetical protein RQ862_01890 [Candidatus Caldarchaeales archaeon]|nr:hypothetical protein [Candidatus Caldarchaeales archaeon]
MANQVSIFEDIDYIKLREKIQNIETVDEALALLESINVTYQLSQWAIVDIIYHFQQHHPNLLSSLEAGLIWTLNLEPSQVSQLKRVAAVFGDVSKRFPALSFGHHILLAYAAAYLDWNEVVRIAKEAEYNAWGVRETRYAIGQVRREKILKEVKEKGEEALEKKGRGRTAAVVEEVKKELLEKPEPEPEPEVEVEVDLKKEVELREKAKEEEKKRILTDTAIRAADAYIRYGGEFIDYLLEALTTAQWDFYHRLTSKMKKRIPMLVTAKSPVADICTTLSSLLDLLIKYQEGGIHEGDELGQETEEF